MYSPLRLEQRLYQPLSWLKCLLIKLLQLVFLRRPLQYPPVGKYLALFLELPHLRLQRLRFPLEFQSQFRWRLLYRFPYQRRLQWLIDRVQPRMNYPKYRWNLGRFHRFLVHYLSQGLYQPHRYQERPRPHYCLSQFPLVQILLLDLFQN